ncbi:peptidase C13 family protein [Cooperia oncophora]
MIHSQRSRGCFLFFNFSIDMHIQADVAHAYHTLLNHGIKKKNIIVMMYDDIADISTTDCSTTHDRIFVYFSGHGSTGLIAFPGGRVSALVFSPYNRLKNLTYNNTRRDCLYRQKSILYCRSTGCPPVDLQYTASAAHSRPWVS